MWVLHISWSVSLIFLLFFKTFLLSNLHETFYIDLFWVAICDVCISFSKFLPPLPPKMFPLFLNISLLSDLDETSYMDSFWDAICDIMCIYLFPPISSFPSLMGTRVGGNPHYHKYLGVIFDGPRLIWKNVMSDIYIILHY